MNKRPVGFLDSGMGGISVLGHALRLLPDENFVYYGDTANIPYGDKPLNTITELTRKGVDILLEHECKAIVIACNTATSAAAAILRKELSIPVLGIEPALKPAAMMPGDGRIAVLATRMTLRLPKFQALMEQYAPDALLIPCSGLMECVERGELDGPELDKLLDSLLSPCQGIQLKAAVLGCTHYPFLRSAISRHLGGIPLLDGGEGTARYLRQRLQEEGLTSDGPGGSVQFLSSSNETDVISRMERMLEKWKCGNN